LNQLSVTEVIEPNLAVEAAVAEAFKAFGIGNLDSETFRLGVVDCARERNQLVNGNFVRRNSSIKSMESYCSWSVPGKP